MRPREYDISGVVMLRRRLGGGGGVLDVQVGASTDDGYSGHTGDWQPTFIRVRPGKGSTQELDAWARFTNMIIPNGATINVAYLTVQAATTGNDGFGIRSNIYAEDADNPAAPTSQANHAAKTRTTAFTAWDDEDFVVDTNTNSPDISAVIKEIVDRGAWASGNTLQILWDNDGSNGSSFYDLYSWDGTAAKAIKLHVEWS